MLIRTLGIDIGIASIGWAVIEENDKELKIVKSGVRIFTKAENPKTKESLALPRRLARSARKRTRRKRERLKQIKLYLSQTLNIPFSQMEQNDQIAPLFRADKDFLSPWELRSKALDSQLNNQELARVILHIAKSRGYDDITYGIEDKERGKITKAIQENQALCRKEGYQTIGEMMFKQYFQKPRESISPTQYSNVRNKKGAYNRCIGRSELRAELQIILDSQKSYNPIITQEFCTKLLGDPQGKTKQQKEGLIFFQRPLKSFNDKIGKCQHIRKGKESPNRACKHAPSAEEFIAITKIINFLMNLKNLYGDVSFSLKETIDKTLQEAQKTKKGLTYSKLKTLLDLPSDFEFRGLDYSEQKSPESAIFLSLSSTFELNKITQNRKLQDEIANILGANKDWGIIQKELETLKLSDDEIQALEKAELNFSQHINLSLEALYHILPLMKEGKRYDEAVSILQEKGIFAKPISLNKHTLPPLDELAKEDSYFDIPNPVLKRALSEFRKVVNALIEQYGSFHYFNIELARDVSNGKKRRNELERINRENQKENTAALKQLENLGLAPTFKNRLKCKLWIQQNKYCLYSGEEITIEDLKDEKALQIDHALPLSRSLDDSQSNQVLCLTSSNQDKLNKTPYEWFGNNEEKWNAYVKRVYASKFSSSKKKKLTLKNFKDRSNEDFLARNLVDTGYIGRAVKEYVKLSLSFLPLPQGKKEHIRIISGSMTSTMRSYWGIQDKNREHHLHHAQDAIIIGCIQPSVIQKYTTYLKEKETHKLKSYQKAQILQEGDYKTKLASQWPMPDFKNKVQESIEQIIVSHRVSHKVSGELHKATAYGKNEVLIPLKERIIKAQAKGEKYKEGVNSLEYSNVEQRDLAIKLGKIREVNGFLVKNGEMIRVDIFKSKDKGRFYAVPIYTYDFAIGKLPNKAIVAMKGGIIKDWIEMDENYSFCFSLFKNDAIQFQISENNQPILGIFKGINSSKGKMDIEHHSKFSLSSCEQLFFINKEKQPSFFREDVNFSNFIYFQKVKLSPLGEIKPLKPSKRQGITIKAKRKNV